MIITEEQGKEKTDVAGDAPDRPANARAEQDHPPPPYSPGASGATPEASMPNLQATNYAHVNRKHAPIRGHSAQLTLPRSFRGKLILHTVYGRIALSKGLEKVTAVLWEVDGTRVCFVGDRPAKWKNTLTNDGDELYDGGQIGEGEDVDEAWVGTRDGAVSVRFEGEPEPDKVQGVLGSVMKIFGL
ncbi:hypothetical protein EWM64_g4049 [Hericium alpestre]|uniref:DUF7330 domain-containing protein n=1 Tax=Hericium alpestre TaxID=135208 RepID=A0A4Z0A273_9AGAM|nr:hypothetical protein EWM64_g4049 [Hericium alpestre]